MFTSNQFAPASYTWFNQLEIYDDTYEFNIFIETTRWFDIKVRIDLENIFDVKLQRGRTIFTGERNLSPIAFHEVRDRTRGCQLGIILSGNF